MKLLAGTFFLVIALIASAVSSQSSSCYFIPDVSKREYNLAPFIIAISDRNKFLTELFLRFFCFLLADQFFLDGWVNQSRKNETYLKDDCSCKINKTNDYIIVNCSSPAGILTNIHAPLNCKAFYSSL
jgi:hypothetical protein